MKTYIIAEIGVNHNGCLDTAKSLIDKASDAEVDAVKFQIFDPNLLVDSHTPMADYQAKNTGVRSTQLDMLKGLSLSNSMHEQLKSYCEKLGLDYLATPFDHRSLAFLTEILLAPKIKIASGEITNAPLLLNAAQSNAQIILSTGMSTVEEIESALGVLSFGYLNKNVRHPTPTNFMSSYVSPAGKAILKEKVTLLQCTTEYPCPYENINLHVIESLRERFNLPVGLSDHSMGTCVSVAAIALGAIMIEKHFTLDCSQPGPDHAASIEPPELVNLVKSIRNTEQALGTSTKFPTSTESNNKRVIRKHIVASKNIKSGEQFSTSNISCKRCSSGISPFRYWEVLKQTAKRNFCAGDIIEL